MSERWDDITVKRLLKENEELEKEIEELNNSITWWQNRFKAVERDNRELKEEIERLNKRETSEIEKYYNGEIHVDFEGEE